MSSIDERVVQMKFNNAQFQQGVSQTTASLDNLNQKLQLPGATKGLNDVNAAASKFSLAHISEAVDGIANKFSAMGVVAITTLSNITNRAISAGTQLVKSLTIDPITTGLREYETNLNSIQTILANTQVSGAGLKEVNAALDELNHYSDQTIYNFSEMARNIGTFTAAGVGLKPATAAIKGIANLAALSGSNTQQASGAMYQLSQAIASGKVSLMDWNSVVNAGMGGTTFQRALAQTAVAMGQLPADALKLSGEMKNVTIHGKSFRDSIDATNGPSWLSSDVLVKTLSQFTGDLTDAQVKAMGFKDAEVAAIQQMAKTAMHAATEVKTMTALIDTAKEVAGSGWSETWRYIFGDFEEAKTMWTNASNAINHIIEGSADARNKILADWKALGGRTALIDTVKNVWSALGSVIKPIKDAFREIFPATTGKQLYDLTVIIRDFTAKLKIGGETADQLKRTFAGVFAIFGIGWDIIKEVAKTLFHLFGVATEGSGGILKVTASIGDFIVKLRDAIHNGDGLSKFFQGLGKILEYPINLIKTFAKVIAGLALAIGAISVGGIDNLVERVKPLGGMGKLIESVWSKIGPIFEAVHKAFSPLAQKMSEFFKNLAKNIQGGISNIDYSKVLDSINTGLFAGLALMLHRFLGSFKLDNIGGNFFGPLKPALEGLTGTFEAMQTKLKADAMLKIAAAVGILALSLIALSFIDPAKLATATAAIAALFGELVGTLALLDKVGGPSKLPVIATGLILLAIAVDLLAIAVVKLAKLDWQGLARGLTGLTVVLGLLIGTMKLMPDDKKMMSTAASLVVLAVAIKLLASAVTDLSGLSWEEMARGLVGVGALLGGLILFTKFSEANKGGLAQGAGLLLLAVGIKILANAMGDLANLSWEGIAKGLVSMEIALGSMAAALTLIPPTAPLGAAAILITAIAMKSVADVLDQMGAMGWEAIGKAMVALFGALTFISLALTLIPPTAPLGAAAIYITALALKDVADVLDQMGAMDWGAIGKAMVALGGSLLLIAAGTTAMLFALPGAVAMLVVAGALKILAPVLQMFGDMSWEEIGKGLVMLAGAFTVIAIGGLLLLPVVPILLAFGVAVTLLGVGVLLAGAGVFLFAAGLTALAVAGAAGAAAIVGIVSALIGLIPLVMQQIGLGIIAFAEVIAMAGPAITKAIVTVLNALIDAITIMTPKIVNTLLMLLTMMLNSLANYVPKMVDAGLKLLTGILKGIANNLENVITAATDVIVAFLNGISKNIGRVTDAGVKLIISFVNGLADAIRNNTEAMHAAGKNLAMAIIDGLTGGLGSGISKVASKARDVAKSALKAAMDFLDINSPSKKFIEVGKSVNEGFAKGLDKYTSMTERSAEGVGATALDTVRNSLSGLAKIAVDEIDVNPTITPVLDLSDVKKNAGQIGGIFADHPLIVKEAYTKAKSVSADYQSNQTLADAKDSGGDTNVNFTQINNSPKALSSADIYRQTKNQLSVAKGALASSAN